MNVILLHTHDTGRFIQPYGYPVHTPNLQNLAEQGILFRNAFTTAPTCSPSRATLMTGQYPHSCGMLGLTHRGFSLQDYSRHMSHYFRDHGYETVLSGIQHETEDISLLGYTRLLDSQDYDMGKVDFNSIEFDKNNADAVCRYLKEGHDTPFFLSFGMYNTHRRWIKHDETIDPAYLSPFPGCADTVENREDMADYLHSVGVVDEIVGQVMQTLKETGLLETSVVIFTTDHGVPVPHMKCTLSDFGTGVSLMLRYPEYSGAGVCIDSLVCSIDIFPTLCDLCGLEEPHWLEGKSLRRCIEHGEVLHESVFSEVNYHAAYEPMRAVRNQRYKYIRRYNSHMNHVLSNIDSCPEKEFLNESGYFSSTQHDEEALFDLYIDPFEKQNLSSNPSYAGVLDSMRENLLTWMEETHDPLLKGELVAPVNAIMNAQTDYSAEDINTHGEIT